MRVAVLCGGKGTRLGTPVKCLTEVAGRPFMDWKLDQLERFGADHITLVVGPFLAEFQKRYGSRVRYMEDDQSGVRNAVRHVDGWWTWGDTLLDQLPEGKNVCYVVPGDHIAGLWLDAGLYHGQGPWQMKRSAAWPLTINTPTDLERCGAHLLRLGLAVGD